MFLRFILPIVVLVMALPAHAASIAVVDFQRAVMETDEGKAAQAELDTLYANRRQELERMRNELEESVRDFQSRSQVLSEQARANTGQQLMQREQQLEALSMQYQQEMQQAFMAKLEDLDGKMRNMTGQIAREEGYTVVLDSMAVVYAGPKAEDITDTLIERYNAGQ